VFGTHGDAATPISVQDLHERMESGESLYVLDVRARASYEGDPEQIPGDIRVLPDQIADWADRQDAGSADCPVLRLTG
jgi:hypothetical protein